MTEASLEEQAFEASLTLQSLAAGKPPGPLSSACFFFGRSSLLELLGRDLATIDAGHWAMRFIVGELGAGKSALLGEYMDRARRSRFVTMRVEFSRDCLLHGRGGEGRKLLEHALLDMKTLGSGDRCAMDAIVGGFRDRCEQLALETGRSLQTIQQEQLAPLEVLPRGYDFARAIELYIRALALADASFLRKVHCWLRGQFENSAESRATLGLQALDDTDFWSMMKLWAKFVRLAGRPGLVLVLDEARLLSELLTGPSRAANFAQIFHIYNELVQGQVRGLGVFVAATPNLFSEDFNGFFSEPGLKSCFNRGESMGCSTDLVESIAVRISDLAYDDLETMLRALRDLINCKNPGARTLADSEIPLFIERSKDRLGGQDYPLPRNMIQAFIKLHNQLASNPSLEWSDMHLATVSGGQSFAAAAAESGEFAERSM